MTGQVSYAQEKNNSFKPAIDLLQFNTEDGLDAHEVTAITEDEEGFIWLGTDKGLQRFDGSQLKVFLPDPDDPYSIPSEKIMNLLMGTRHQLWIGTQYNGVAALDLKTMRFKSYQSIKDDPTTLAGNIICGLLEDNEGLWVLSRNAYLSYLSFRTGKFTRYSIQRPFIDHTGFFISPLSHMIADKTNPNIIWFPTVMGLYEFNKSSGLFNIYVSDPSKRKIFIPHFYQDIWQDDSGIIWCSLYNGIESFNPKTKIWNKYPFLKEIDINDGFKSSKILPEPPASLLLLTDPFNWIRFDLLTKQYETHDVKLSNKGHGEDPWVMSACRTKNGDIWFGGWQAFNKVNTHSLPFYTSFFTDKDNQVLTKPNMPIASVEIGKTRQVLIGIFVGDGLLLIEDYKTGKCTPIHSTPKLPKNALEGALEDIEQRDSLRWWLGVRGGLFEYTVGDSLVRPYVNKKGELVFRGNIRSLFADKDETLWIGTLDKGLYHLDPKNNSVKHYEHQRGDPSSLSSDEMICDIIRGPDDRIWVGTQSCISILDDEAAGKFIQLNETLPGMPHSTELAVTDLDIDASGNVWAATGQGIIKIIFKNKKTIARTYSIRQGLESSITHELLVDRNGNVWITTDNSLSFFNAQTESFINFGQRDGISHVSGSDIIEQLSDGNIIYGMWNSLLWFNPDSITNYRQLPNPYLFRVLVNNTDYTTGNTNDLNNLKLSHSTKNISFQMAGLDLGGNFRHYFAYKLSGYDDDWIYAGKRSYADYTHLPPGKYTFQYKVANSMGQWNPSIKELIVNIRPALWQAWWFKVSAALLLALVVFIVVRKRIKAIRHEAEMKQKMAETEMMALRAQMNPHFIFNCLSAIDNLVQTNQPDKATTYLARFAKLIRSVLDSSKNNVVSFQKDFESLQLYLEMEQFRCNNKFNYQLDASETLLMGDYPVPPLIIQPFIENAIHHGLLNKIESDKNLKIEISTDQHYINYTITDNGVGRQRAAELKMINKPEHESYGIRISTDRIHLYNKNGITDDIIITDLEENGNASGTKIEVKIKIHDTH